MRKETFKKSIATLGVLTLLISIFSTTALGATNEAVSVGADLTPSQKQQMLTEFGVNKEDTKIIEITVHDIREQLGMPPVSQNVKGNSYSSSYVRIEEPGYGIKVATKNLTEVTGTMLQNALLTSGVTDADVRASSPFEVTGTAALAGILKGFEDVTGTELSLEQKEIAKEEIKVTGSLGEATKEDGSKLGKDEAAVIINDIKTQVIKDSPKTDIKIDKIVTNVTNNYNITLTPHQKQEVVRLMSDVNKVDFDYSKMKDSLNKMGQNLKEQLSSMGKELKESGIFEKMWNSIKSGASWCWEKGTDLVNWIKSLVSDVEQIKEKDGVKYDKDGNLILEDISTETPNSKNNNESGVELELNETPKNPLNETDNKTNNNETDSNKTNNSESSTGNSEMNTSDSNTTDTAKPEVLE